MKHEKNEGMEVYYEILLKSTNSLQHKTTNNFLNTIFRYGLQPYLHVAIVSMKKETLQQNKEATLFVKKEFLKWRP
jgi:hypothetical protein